MRFQPGRDVHAVAENVVSVHDHVAQIDADAELDATILRDIFIPAGHGPLDFGRAGHGIHDAGELDQHAVAGDLDDTTVVLRDLAVDEFPAMGLERAERRRLVQTHQAAVADHVGGEDSSEASLHEG